MADKSPRQAMSKKPAKSLKEKRAEKRSKSGADGSGTEKLNQAKKR